MGVEGGEGVVGRLRWADRFGAGGGAKRVVCVWEEGGGASTFPIFSVLGNDSSDLVLSERLLTLPTHHSQEAVETK